jgi:hypothetical protein
MKDSIPQNAWQIDEMAASRTLVLGLPVRAETLFVAKEE